MIVGASLHASQTHRFVCVELKADKSHPINIIDFSQQTTIHLYGPSSTEADVLVYLELQPWVQILRYPNIAATETSRCPRANLCAFSKNQTQTSLWPLSWSARGERRVTSDSDSGHNLAHLQPASQPASQPANGLETEAHRHGITLANLPGS